MRLLKDIVLYLLHIIESSKAFYEIFYLFGKWILQLLLWLTFVSILFWKFDTEWSFDSPSLWAVVGLTGFVMGSLGKTLSEFSEGLRSAIPEKNRQRVDSWIDRKITGKRSFLFEFISCAIIGGAFFGMIVLFVDVVLLFGSPFTIDEIREFLEK